jgi:hypothetical protein
MSKTVLILGPTGAGKAPLLAALAGEHPGHQWHRVHLEPGQQTRVESLPTPGDFAGCWQVRYRPEQVAATLPGLLHRIEKTADARPAVIAFSGQPDALLRHALAYDLRVFVMPPIDDETVLFRSTEQATDALRQILRDTSSFAREVTAMTGPDDPGMELEHPSLSAELVGGDELHEPQVREFLCGPLGAELAMRVHMQPAFGGIGDADIIVMNAAAGPRFSENNHCWQRLLGLLDRIRSTSHRAPLTCVCDLSDREDPCFVRVRQRMGKVVCQA